MEKEKMKIKIKLTILLTSILITVIGFNLMIPSATVEMLKIN